MKPSLIRAGFVQLPARGEIAASGAEAEGVLIDQALRGGADAFADLVLPHLTSAFRFARMRLRSDSEAEDVVQQAVLQAFRHLGKFRREASFKTWFSRIAFNEVSHLRRRLATARTIPLNAVPSWMFGDSCGFPDAQSEQKQEIERLCRAVTSLPEKYRLVIQLRDLRELSIAETARSLSLTISATKTRHHRARKLLRRSLLTHTGRGAGRGIDQRD